MKFNLRKTTLTFLMLVFTVALYSQNGRTCGTTAYMKEKMQDPVFAKKQKLQNLKFKESLARIKSGDYKAKMATLIVPVAVHFPEGNESERPCLEALAQSQVDVLNQDYTATNTDISNWAAASGFYPGTNTGAFDVEFILANRNHPANTDDDLVEGGPAVTVGYDFGGGNDADIKWAGYKNFLVKTIDGGTLGYSPLGGSIASGRAVVMNTFAFGSDAIASGCVSNGTTFIPQAPYNLGRTVTHELGHYFTLNHTFDDQFGDSDGCNGVNDGYADTPAIPASNGGCPAAGSVPGCVNGEFALTMNYMDYVNDACMWMFTQDQADAVQAYWAVEAAQLLTNVVLIDYNLNFASTSVDVCQPTDAVYTFDYDADDSFSDTVTFSASGLPVGTTATFVPATADADENVTMTISGITTAGVSNVTVTGAYATETQNYPVTLSVFDSVLSTPGLITPADTATGVVDQTMTWGAVASATSYDVNIYDDAGLGAGDLVENATVNTNTYSPMSLLPVTTYYWTVTANNSVCATSSSVSATSSFTTENIVCSNAVTTDSSVVIPAGLAQPQEGAPAVQVINYIDGVNITDVNVTLNITHVWVQDLRVVLTSPTGTQVELFANVIGNAQNFTNTVLDDQAAGLLSAAATAEMPFTASYQPTNALSAFNGEVSLGNWTLEVYDFWDTDNGTLDSWSLDICGIPLPDTDNDGVYDINDNCINTANPGQEDWNNDGEGDACDNSDGDSHLDDVDNCVTTDNEDQLDTDNNGQGDVCQDTDNDGVFDVVDNCINIANPGQEDWDNDGEGDVCDDTDADGVFDDVDNCINTANSGQEDWNNDGEGDACDNSDGDSHLDDVDNCVTTDNEDQLDTDTDGVGDVCDNCVNTSNADQADGDADGFGDVCDNCPTTANPGQEDMENDGEGDACQVYDADNDGVLDDVDNCVNTANPLQEDVDNNGIGDACQDTDNDTILDINDNCPNTDNVDQADVDGNGIGDACQDTDNDGVIDINDNCPLTVNPNQEDDNNDGIGDVCESVEPADTLTPNGDGQNDRWNIENIENVSNTVRVFNRHGVKVFDASNYVNNTWGGESTEGGSGLLPAGSYYYVIEYTSAQGEAKVSKGWMYINY